MARRKFPPQPANTATGPISVSAPVAALLEQAIGLERFLEIATSGTLDGAGRDIKFTTRAGHMAKLRSQGLELPDLPEMHGDITWRRREQHWSLDVATVVFNDAIGEEWRWWEMLTNGTGDGQLRVQNVQFPQLVLDQIQGRPLREVLEHPFFTDPGIIIRQTRSYPATTIMGDHSPASVEFKLDVPRIVITR